MFSKLGVINAGAGPIDRPEGGLLKLSGMINEMMKDIGD